MARSKSTGGGRGPADPWAGLTWDDLERWADPGAVARGREYQKSGKVRDLAITAEGHLLATVAGSERYATTVRVRPEVPAPGLDSTCTCFVGFRCKHAVATVAGYLTAVAEGRPVPAADPADPRWEALAAVGDEPAPGWDEDEDAEGDDDEPPPRAARAAGRPAKAGKAAIPDDAAVERGLRSKSAGELVALLLTLAGRYPDVRRELQDRAAPKQKAAARLVAEARDEVRRATARPGYQDSWGRHGGYIPDFDGVTQRFDRLIELGEADEVVALSRDFIKQGFEVAGESDDEGETLEAFGECFPVIFRAVLRSSLTPAERIVFAVDAELQDEWDVIGSAVDVVLDATTTPADWSAAADALSRRLEPVADASNPSEFRDKYGRERASKWIATALERAGRGDELLAHYEAEARASGSYERLVDYLIEQGRTDDVARWAEEGIARTAASYPGTATHLAAKLRAVAEEHGRWDVVAAHAALPFFDRPSGRDFAALVAAAAKAGVEVPARAAALRFLETGVRPYRVTAPPKPTPARSRGKKGGPAPAPSNNLEVDPSWPLPVPGYLVPIVAQHGKLDPGPTFYWDVLLDMAIAARQPDEVLRWYDRIRAAPPSPGYRTRVDRDADRVAEAVAAAHPGRALEIYLAALNAQLPHAEPHAYEAAAGYLRKLRPVYEALGRAGEWDALVTSIRQTYKNRPRFLEQLGRLEGRPIVEGFPKRRP